MDCRILRVAGLVAGLAGTASAVLYMDNGFAAGDVNFMSVTLGDQGGGFAQDLTVVDPNNGNAAVNVLFDTGFVYRSGDTGDFTFMNSSAPTLEVDGSALSSGYFVGPNGEIDFTIRTTLVGRRLNHELALSSSLAFGNVTIANYLDQDVYGYGDDVAVVVGSGSGSQVFTFDDESNVGISHSVDWTSSQNLSFLGWTVYSYQTGATDGGGVGGQSFSPDGVITLPVFDGYAYAEGNPAYGPADVVSAFAFRLDELATSASVSTGNSGVVDGIPEPSTMAAMAMAALLGLGIRRVFAM